MLWHWVEFQAAVAARAGSRPDPRDKPEDDISFPSDPEQCQRRRLVSRRRETAAAPMRANGQVLLFDTAAARARLARFHTPRVEKDQLATSFFRFVANQSQEPRRGGVENLPIEPGLLPPVLAGLLSSATRRMREVRDSEALGEDAGVRCDQLGTPDVRPIFAPIGKAAPPARRMLARLGGALRAFAAKPLG